MDIKHYNQTPRRNAKFITPPNIIKAKVGNGGLNDIILDRAQNLLEHHAIDFAPQAHMYLTQMETGIAEAREAGNSAEECEATIAKILFPCVQLKANGAMFHDPLISRIAERFVQFMEVVERLDNETLYLAEAFYKTLKIVAGGQIKGDGGVQGDALVEELNNACMRYFEKYKDKLNLDKK